MKFKKFIFFLSLISFLFTQKAISTENKIILKINNEIITTLDISYEQKYLSIFNENFKSLAKNQSLEIATNSIIKEKIKEIELNNYIEVDNNENDKNLDDIIKNLYQNIGFENITDFKNYLIKNKLSYNFIKKKIKIEKNWNDLIYSKYFNQIKINEEELKNDIFLKKNNSKAYLLSEIFFSVLNTNEYDKKLSQIEDDIKNIGFENSAIKHSLSQTSTIGGKLDWINGNSLNETILESIKTLNIGEHTRPLNISGGSLIIKLRDIKKIETAIDINKELQNLKNRIINEQLNQFSKIYFDKIKKNILINEL